MSSGYYVESGGMLEVQDNESPISMAYLRRMNLWAGILHLVQAILMVTASQFVERIRDFTIPLSRSYLQVVNETSGALESVSTGAGNIQLGAATSVFLFLSALAHFIVWSPMYFERYSKEIKSGINTARWWEYALSSSVMILLICMLFGVYDVATLLAVAGCNISMNLFGLLMERVNQLTETVDWSPFWYGCFAGLIPWIVCFMSFLGSPDLDKIPGFVYGIFASYLIFFNTFPINMYLQYKQIGRWKDYRYGELWYIILSLASKSLLAWVVFGGTQQPQPEN